VCNKLANTQTFRNNAWKCWEQCKTTIRTSGVFVHSRTQCLTNMRKFPSLETDSLVVEKSVTGSCLDQGNRPYIAEDPSVIYCWRLFNAPNSGNPLTVMQNKPNGMYWSPIHFDTGLSRLELFVSDLRGVLSIRVKLHLTEGSCNYLHRIVWSQWFRWGRGGWGGIDVNKMTANRMHILIRNRQLMHLDLWMYIYYILIIDLFLQHVTESSGLWEQE